ncbi:MAG: SOS response-associated peptidase family protein [Erysipelothrix sp.]|nr:SOS response-associated peptidase family protein [Erysipelothrix sp.]
MCGQIFIQEDLMIAYDIEQLQTLFRPSDELIVTQNIDSKEITHARWGWLHTSSQQLILFARLENIQNSRLFSSAYDNQRCIVLASGYYEWDQSRIKQKIVNKNHEPLYIAAIYNEHQDRVALITHESQPSVAWIHHRQPMVLNKEEAIEYLNHPIKNLDFLRNQDLVVESTMRQASLF